MEFLYRLCYNRLVSLHMKLINSLMSGWVNDSIYGVDYVSIEHLVVWMQRRRDYPV